MPFTMDELHRAASCRWNAKNEAFRASEVVQAPRIQVAINIKYGNAAEKGD